MIAYEVKREVAYYLRIVGGIITLDIFANRGPVFPTYKNTSPKKESSSSLNNAAKGRLWSQL